MSDSGIVSAENSNDKRESYAPYHKVKV